MAEIESLTVQEQVEEVQKYYADLLIMQYREKQKARETIGLGAKLFLLDGLVFQFGECLDVDKAVGVQLDLIGKIVRCERNVQGFNPDYEFFSFEKINALGFSDKNGASDGIFKNWFNSSLSSYALQDEDYRQLIKIKIAYNSKIAKWGLVDEMLFNIFGESVELYNNKNLSITYILSEGIRVAVMAALTLGYLNAPCGVGVRNVIVAKDSTKMFGFRSKLISSNVVGFSDKSGAQEATFLTKRNILK